MKRPRLCRFHLKSCIQFALTIGGSLVLLAIYCVIFLWARNKAVNFDDYNGLLENNNELGYNFTINFVPVEWSSFVVKPLDKLEDVPLYMVSSYIDYRPLLIDKKPVVQLIASVLDLDFFYWWKKEGSLKCLLSLKNSTDASFEIVDSVVAEWDKVFNYRGNYALHLYMCPFKHLSHLERFENYYMTIVPSGSWPLEINTPWIKVRSNWPISWSDIKTSAVCVPPLRGDLYSSSLKTFIETYLELGFSSFFVYIRETDKNTKEVIEYYRNLGILSAVYFLNPGVTSWSGCVNDECVLTNSKLTELDIGKEFIDNPTLKLDYKLRINTRNFSMHYFGQEAATHDCLIRSAFMFKWLAFVDLDELILIEDHHMTLPEYLKNRMPLSPSYGFLNGFYCIHCSDFYMIQKKLMSLFLSLVGDGDARKLYKCFYTVNLDGKQDLSSNIIFPYQFYFSKRQKHFYDKEERSKFILNPSLYYMISIHKLVMSISDKYSGHDRVEYYTLVDENFQKFKHESRTLMNTEYYNLSNLHYVNPFVHPSISHARLPKDMAKLYLSIVNNEDDINVHNELIQSFNKCQKCSYFELRNETIFMDYYARRILKRLLLHCKL